MSTPTTVAAALHITQQCISRIRFLGIRLFLYPAGLAADFLLSLFYVHTCNMYFVISLCLIASLRGAEIPETDFCAALLGLCVRARLR